MAGYIFAFLFALPSSLAASAGALSWAARCCNARRLFVRCSLKIKAPLMDFPAALSETLPNALFVDNRPPTRL